MKKLFLSLVCGASLLAIVSCNKRTQAPDATQQTNNENVAKSYAAVLAGTASGSVLANVYKDGTQSVSFTFDKDGKDEITFNKTGQIDLFSGYTDSETKVSVKINSTNPVSFDVSVPSQGTIVSSSVEASTPDMIEVVEGKASATLLNFDITESNKSNFDLNKDGIALGQKINAVFNIIFNKQTNTFVAQVKPYDQPAGVEDAAAILKAYGLPSEITGVYVSEGGFYVLKLDSGIENTLYLDLSTSNVFAYSSLVLESSNGFEYPSYYTKGEFHYEASDFKTADSKEVFFVDGNLFVDGKLVSENFNDFWVRENGEQYLLYEVEAKKHNYVKEVKPVVIPTTSFVIENSSKGYYTIQSSKEGLLTDQEIADASSKGYNVLVYHDNVFDLNGTRLTGETNISVWANGDSHQVVGNDGLRANPRFLSQYKGEESLHKFSGIKLESKFIKK